MTLIRRFRTFALPPTTHSTLLHTAKDSVGDAVSDVAMEQCYYIDAAIDPSPDDLRVLDWLLAETFEPQNYGDTSFFDGHDATILEVGPRMTFTTAWSTNAV